MSHSGFSAPSGTPAPVPGGSQSERQHSQITPLKPSMSRSPGTPLRSLLSVHWARTQKLCQWPHDPAFTLNANYNNPTAPVLLLPLLWLLFYKKQRSRDMFLNSLAGVDGEWGGGVILQPKLQTNCDTKTECNHLKNHRW